MIRRRFIYVPLEVLKARYTGQLGGEWIPAAFEEVNNRLLTPHMTSKWLYDPVYAPEVSAEIKTGSVLDGINRGLVSLEQMAVLLRRIDEGQLTSDDVIYLQDLWTPGFEAVLYALHLRKLTPRIYAMCHAQSVDEYDFTYPMRGWMRPIEVSWMNVLDGLFVGSTIHRDQLKAAGVICPIHVVGLPIHKGKVMAAMPEQDKLKQVIFSSRLNNEKNPYFMLEVAREFLRRHSDWQWIVTTSAERFTSEVPGFLEALQAYAAQNANFVLHENLSKTGYYRALKASNIQFNSSLQDYVSWTLLEATAAGCDVVYPNFRSFPECVAAQSLYTPFDVDSAVETLEAAMQSAVDQRPLTLCDNGLRIEMSIMLTDWRGPEVNVWHQPASYFKAAGLL